MFRIHAMHRDSIEILLISLLNSGLSSFTKNISNNNSNNNSPLISSKNTNKSYYVEKQKEFWINIGNEVSFCF
jgi:hypothetical protein